MKLLRGVVQMPFKDRKNPERYERGGVNDYEDFDDEMDKQKVRRNQVRPVMKSRVGLSAADLDKLKGLSREEQQRRMNALAKEFSFFGLSKDEKPEH